MANRHQNSFTPQSVFGKLPPKSAGKGAGSGMQREEGHEIASARKEKVTTRSLSNVLLEGPTNRRTKDWTGEGRGFSGQKKNSRTVTKPHQRQKT